MLLLWQYQSQLNSEHIEIIASMCSSRSLGLLNYMRIWHDNSGEGQSASWYLKYIIVRDLQTMNKFYFIAQRWFAVEKNDGRVRWRQYYKVKHNDFISFRSNTLCLWQVTLKNKSFPMSYPRKHITVYLMVICGFRSSPDHLPIDLHVFNDVLVALFSSSSPCYSISCIMIFQMKPNQPMQQKSMV